MANPYYTKPRFYFGEYEYITPQWSGTPQHQPKVLVPGGGHVDANAFPPGVIQSGILVGRTYAERDAGIGYGPADVATDEEIHLLFFDIHDPLNENECELYQSRSGNVVYVNFIPNWATLPTATKTWIYNNYTCLTGVA